MLEELPPCFVLDEIDAWINGQNRDQYRFW